MFFVEIFDIFDWGVGGDWGDGCDKGDGGNGGDRGNWGDGDDRGDLIDFSDIMTYPVSERQCPGRMVDKICASEIVLLWVWSLL